jgi:hypothetical protein
VGQWAFKIMFWVKRITQFCLRWTSLLGPGALLPVAISSTDSILQSFILSRFSGADMTTTKNHRSGDPVVSMDQSKCKPRRRGRNAADLARGIKSYCLELNENKGVANAQNSLHDVKWRRPPDGILKLNCDALFRAEEKAGS